MVEHVDENEQGSHDEHALCPVQFRLQVKDEAIADSSEKIVDCIPDAQILLLGLRTEDVADQDEGDHVDCSAETEKSSAH